MDADVLARHVSVELREGVRERAALIGYIYKLSSRLGRNLRVGAEDALLGYALARVIPFALRERPDGLALGDGALLDKRVPAVETYSICLSITLKFCAIRGQYNRKRAGRKRYAAAARAGGIFERQHPGGTFALEPRGYLRGEFIPVERQIERLEAGDKEGGAGYAE